MNLSRPDADLYLPDGSTDAAAALARVTHLCIGAHQDDIEIMAHAGIATCLDTPGKAFGGVVVTNGAGSPRSGPYAHLTDEQMQVVRREEQRKAAELGRYAIQIQLAHPSADVKQPGHAGVAADLRAIVHRCDPEVIYLHNPADKHDTHIAVLLRCLEALRSRPAGRPLPRVLGCEVWRDLDWLLDADKVALDASAHPDLAAALLKVFDSQVTGGKRYDLAALGRRLANATFHTAHATDQSTALTWAIDLTPLLTEPNLSLEAYTLAAIDRLRSDVQGRLRRYT
jgi:LmbE family N-acetylglucosaminyl deacetylase